MNRRGVSRICAVKPEPEQGGKRYPDPGEDDDGDGLINEDPINGLDDDLDGQIDEDFGAISNQMFRATMRATGSSRKSMDCPSRR